MYLMSHNVISSYQANFICSALIALTLTSSTTTPFNSNVDVISRVVLHENYYGHKKEFKLGLVFWSATIDDCFVKMIHGAVMGIQVNITIFGYIWYRW